jgi:hypothetical protein
VEVKTLRLNLKHLIEPAGVMKRKWVAICREQSTVPGTEKQALNKRRQLLLLWFSSSFPTPRTSPSIYTKCEWHGVGKKSAVFVCKCPQVWAVTLTRVRGKPWLPKGSGRFLLVRARVIVHKKKKQCLRALNSARHALHLWSFPYLFGPSVVGEGDVLSLFIASVGQNIHDGDLIHT